MKKDSIFNKAMKVPWPLWIVGAVLVIFVFHTYQLVAPQDAMNQAILSVIWVVAYGVVGGLLVGSLLSFFSRRNR
jgi:hypothetical protein